MKTPDYRLSSATVVASQVRQYSIALRYRACLASLKTRFLAEVRDEAIEAAAVRVARGLVRQGGSPQEIYQQLLDLHERQPNMSVRTSGSVERQAYFTPLPLAYVAGMAAGIEPGKSVYEPTAGQGALLLLAEPEDVICNEIDPVRAEELKQQGFTFAMQDGLAGAFKQKYTVPKKTLILQGFCASLMRSQGKRSFSLQRVFCRN